MTPDFSIAWLIFNIFLAGITLVWGIFRYRRGIWLRKPSLKFLAYLLWGIGGVALVSSAFPFSYLYTEHLWFFESVGYDDVFWKLRKIRWGIFAVFFLVALGFMNINAAIAKLLCPEPGQVARRTHERTVSFHRAFFFGSVILALLFAIPMMSLQNDFLRYLNQPKSVKTVLANPELENNQDVVTEQENNQDVVTEQENNQNPTAVSEDNQNVTTASRFFGKDVNFYLFSYPIHKAVSLWIEILLWVTGIVVGLLYNFYYRRDTRSKTYAKRNIVLHGSILWLMLLGAGIWRVYVNLWTRVYTPSPSTRFSEFHGLFYADSKLTGATQVYSIILIIIGVVVLLNLFWRKRLLWYAAIAVSVVSYLCLIHLYPLGVNFWKVRSVGQAYPVEANYLAKHIQNTREAFDLDTIKVEKFEKGLATLDTVLRNDDVRNNIQFWDRQIFYNILRNEEIKRHHNFHPYADVDRYHLKVRKESSESEGEGTVAAPGEAAQDASEDLMEPAEQYKQVLIAAREIDPDPGPKEWGELKLKFTHGYGVCVAPVNEVDGSSPVLWVKGVPISQKAGLNFPELEVKQPRIYYGEMTTDYVIVKTKNPEYNIEEEEENAKDETAKSEKIGYHYDGTGGVELGGWLRRFCFAARFTSVYILRNSSLDRNSRVMYWRRIGTRHNKRLVVDRLSHIAPFLDYDPDPYIVIDNGQLWWIVDFYVTSDRYPNAQFYKDDTAPMEYNELELYAEPRFKRFKKFNYIRNPGVAVVNAYTGKVNFYTENDNEVIIGIYRKVFPNLFKSIDEMPEGLKAHRRFPDYLTRIQAKMYGDYHITNAETFFDKKKQWKIPMEAYYSETLNQEMMPYYLMLKLPGEEKAEFVNMIPFTPPQKDNFMKGWLIARCDPPHYGQRIVYTLPDSLNVKGPKHVEDDISKDTELSEIFLQLRDNNEILRGNLHVIPIENGIYYVEPIYVKRKKTKAKNGNETTDVSDPIRHLPTLKTIVVKAADHELAADLSFVNALVEVFLGQSRATSSTESEKVPTLTERFDELMKSYKETGKALEEIAKALKIVEPANVQKTVKKKNKK